jgi:hypothetical protein
MWRGTSYEGWWIMRNHCGLCADGVELLQQKSQEVTMSVHKLEMPKKHEADEMVAQIIAAIERKIAEGSCGWWPVVADVMTKLSSAIRKGEFVNVLIYAQVLFLRQEL